MRALRVLVLLVAIVAAGLAVALLAFPEQVQGLRFQHLSQAAYEGSVSSTRLLLWLGADPDGGDYNETVPFEFVTPLGVAASRGNADVVRVLLEHGADPDVADPTGFTPLVHAASQGHADVVRVLLDAGAHTDVVSMSGTALDVARSAGNTEVVRLLEADEAASAGSGSVRGGGPVAEEGALPGTPPAPSAAEAAAESPGPETSPGPEADSEVDASADAAAPSDEEPAPVGEASGAPAAATAQP